ncbi:MAG TPA: GNAT family N-acetyltransferase [Candidatus Nanopelagicales bacterium]|nr:GNAT family N-acetyltransferase [Candidatus Nanopelagicales bacterium]
MAESPDRALARKLEEAEASAGEWCHAALRRFRQGTQAAVERVAGGVVAYAGARSPLTRGRGLGMDGPVSAEEVDRLEHFFRSRGVPATLELSPYADPTLLTHLGRRGFALTGFDHVLVRPISGAERAPAQTADLRVARAVSLDGDEWARVVAQGFADAADADAVDEDAVDMGRLLFHEDRVACFWAHAGGRPIAGGAMAIHGDLASMFGASTLPAHRGRGAQRALLETRLAHAAASGCELASVVTQPGTASQRNAERAGFRVAYTRATLEKRWS